MPTPIPTIWKEIANLYESGLGYKAIAKRLGLKRGMVVYAVRKMARDRGLSAPEPQPQVRPFRDLPTETLDKMMAIINRRKPRLSL